MYTTVLKLPDSFTYKTNDGNLDSNTVTVTITVTKSLSTNYVTVKTKRALKNQLNNFNPAEE
jgi:hypothetical protein